MVLNVLIKNENPNICGTGGQRVKGLMIFNFSEQYCLVKLLNQHEIHRSSDSEIKRERR